MTKEDLVLALLNEGVEGFVEIEVPSFGELPSPVSDDMTANSYTLATYAVNCNAFMQCFSGLKLFDFLLRGLQRSNPMIALVLASLEKVGTSLKIYLISPEGTEWAGYIPMIISGSPDIVRVHFTGIMSGGDLPKNGNIFALSLPVAPQTVALEFIGYDVADNPTDSISLSIDVLAFGTDPVEDQEIGTIGYTFRLLTGLGTTSILGVSLKIDNDPGQLYDMTRTSNSFDSDVPPLAEGSHTAKFMIGYFYNGSLREIDQTTSFTVAV